MIKKIILTLVIILVSTISFPFLYIYSIKDIKIEMESADTKEDKKEIVIQFAKRGVLARHINTVLEAAGQDYFPPLIKFHEIRYIMHNHANIVAEVVKEEVTKNNISKKVKKELIRYSQCLEIKEFVKLGEWILESVIYKDTEQDILYSFLIPGSPYYGTIEKHHDNSRIHYFLDKMKESNVFTNYVNYSSNIKNHWPTPTEEYSARYPEAYLMCIDASMQSNNSKNKIK